MNEPFILWFDQIEPDQVALVGGKNASLGAMYRHLAPKGINLANGFAVTTAAYRAFLKSAGLVDKLEQLFANLDTKNLKELQACGRAARDLILRAELPEELKAKIRESYRNLSNAYGSSDTDTAVRSSATAEDLPGASFAGQQETFLNVHGEENVLRAVKGCFASLFTDRAISYRADQNFNQLEVALSVAVQKMVRSDKASSGVAFSLDTETGFDKVVIINSIWGLGELIVQGAVTPDEFVVFKPTLQEGYRAILSQTLGVKDRKMIYRTSTGKRNQLLAGHATRVIRTKKSEQTAFSLNEDEVLTLARWIIEVENYFSGLKGSYQPMDIEWAKDGVSNQLYIVQARPETVHARADKNVYSEYRLKEKGQRLVAGTAVGTKIANGQVRVIKDPKSINSFEPGEVLVTTITDPDWEPIMKIASAIVTDKGGRTSHAAIVSRELGIPCIVGTGKATSKLKTGQTVTVDCSGGGEGVVYKGNLEFEQIAHQLDQVPSIKTKLMMNIGAPDEAFKNHALPVAGIGLGRLEFIITSYIRIHPRALIDYTTLKQSGKSKDRALVRQIAALTTEHEDKITYYIDELAEGVAKIAASVHPRPAIIRFSDFKTNEYRTLIGGDRYEPIEENPMLGWRGASRYYHPEFAEAFRLEVLALARARNVFGLKNIIPMIPFCRTLEEAEKVLKIMAENGLDRAIDQSLKVYMMAEIPANVIQAHDFLNYFDGFSIGSNDLTQLTLGLDRDSSIVAPIANENHPAIKEMIDKLINICRERGKYLGICGQAPSDYPDFARFLVEKGIESLSLNPDTVIKSIGEISEIETK